MSPDELAARRALHSLRSLTSPESDGVLVSDASDDRAAAAEDRRLAAADRRRIAESLSAAFLDDLTGVIQRSPGRQRLQSEVERAHRESASVTFLFFDVDGLKEVNDRNGHRAGDRLLAATGAALRATLRSYDVVVRYGGDEFVCALPGGTEAIGEGSIQRVRSALAKSLPGVGLSAGQAQLAEIDTLDDVIHRADSDMYRRRAERGQTPDTRGSRPCRTCEINAVGSPWLNCGVCGAAILLAEFSIKSIPVKTREAKCPGCGTVTLIQLEPQRA